MTPQIALVLAILVAAIIMFVTERIRVDVVALMVLVSLALTGLVTPPRLCPALPTWLWSRSGRC